MNQCIDENNEETTESKPAEFKIPDALLKELELYSAKDLIDAIIYMKNNKNGNFNVSCELNTNEESFYTSYDEKTYREEQESIVKEYNSLNTMFVYATRYLHTQETEDEQMMKTFRKIFDDLRQLYDLYTNRLDEYSNQKFGISAHSLRYKLLKEEIKARCNNKNA